MQREMEPAYSRWTGWIGFGGLMMIVIGSVDVLEGLIAVIRDKYYALGPNQIIVFDMTTWGWLTILWGLIVAFAGYALLARSGWARWFAIVVGSLNVLGQLAFLGQSPSPLWLLTTISLSILVLYALIVHWGDVESTL